MIRLTTLGATDLRDTHGHQLREVLAQPKRIALLIYLALESRHHPVRRDTLLALFWPDADAERARNTLSQSLHHLRSVIGAEAIESVGASALAARGDRLWCDAAVFGDALERGDRALALDVYRGDFCAGLFVSGAPEAERWFDEQRARLRRLAIGAACEHAISLEQAGARFEAARMARHALELRPDDEAAVRQMLALQSRCGDPAGAVVAYERFARRLAEELEIEPAPATRQLAAELRQQRDAASLETLETKPAALEPQPPQPPVPRTRRAPLILLATAFLVLLGGSLLWSGRPRQPPRALDAVAVFPFAVRGPAALHYLGEGLVDLLSAKLDGTGGLRAIDPRAIIARLDSAPSGPDEAARAARALGAARFIVGEVVLANGRVQLSAALYQPGRGPPLATAAVTGDSTAVFDLVDGLAGRILAGLTAGRDEEVTRLAALTTQSLPALKAFLDGQRLLRAGSELRAFEAFRDALTLDSTFALAYYRGSLVAGWANAGSPADGPAWAAAAARHSGQLSPVMRDLLAGLHAYRETRIETAERHYRSVLSLRPDHVDAWLMMGEIQFHYNPLRGRSPFAARDAFRRALALDPDDAHAPLHLARLALLDGRRAELDSLVADYLARHPQGERAQEMRAMRLLRDGQPAAAIAEARGAGDFVLNSVTEAAAMFGNDLASARRLAEIGADRVRAPWLRVTAQRLLADLAVAAGQLEPDADAADPRWLTESQAALAAEPFFPVADRPLRRLRQRLQAEPWTPVGTPGYRFDVATSADMRRYLEGRLSLRLGDSAGVRQAGLALAAGRSEAAPFLRAALRGARFRSEGRAEDALAGLRQLIGATNARGHVLQMSDQHVGTGERFAAAEVLLSMGRDSAALELYETFVRLADVPFIAAAHYRRGEIQERWGHRDRAAFHYGRALRIWQEVGGQAPLRQRARLALERVSAQ